MTRWVRICIGIGIIIFLMAIGGLLVRTVLIPIYFVHGLRNSIVEKERQLLYSVDHEAFASEARKFATDERWRNNVVDSQGDFFKGSDVTLPAALRILKPTEIRVFDDRVECDFGGPWLSFGIAVFRRDSPGQGLKRLG